MHVLFIAGYELGHQPLHVAGPAGRVRAAGHEARAIDLSMQSWDPDLVDWADRIAISVPMHTAARLARRAIEAIRQQRADVAICAYGLYAPTLADVADRTIAGETDVAILAWVDHEPRRGVHTVHLDRTAATPGAPLPARDLLPALDRYAHLAIGDDERPVAYIEASHGCAHRCRHCPVPVVYDGRIRLVAVDDVLADVAQVVGSGARHVTFGDPDFLNGIHHSLRVARAVHSRFPDLTFDCTVTVEHILWHADTWPALADLGCGFVVSAFEPTNDTVLERLDKGHTAADAARAVELLRDHAIEIRPTWLPFTPWTTFDDVRDLLRFVAHHDLVPNVDPVQYTIRLLIPKGSLLLDLPDVLTRVASYDDIRQTYPWRAQDPRIDDLQVALAALVEGHLAAGTPIPAVFRAVCDAAGVDWDPASLPAGSVEGRPRLTEPWFC
ncbi:MAG: hypothetical protein AMXMBFR46_10030 [Acidimicrobiia bacterium]